MRQKSSLTPSGILTTFSTRSLPSSNNTLHVNSYTHTHTHSQSRWHVSSLHTPSLVAPHPLLALNACSFCRKKRGKKKKQVTLRVNPSILSINPTFELCTHDSTPGSPSLCSTSSQSSLSALSTSQHAIKAPLYGLFLQRLRLPTCILTRFAQERCS